ncbi:hypothetical protein LX36DRAFT_388672 [Colletotrichum falcatum]|nr:hypothetical protein LX36DRAFT_388672 [Colletotrichum falcatum]
MSLARQTEGRSAAVSQKHGSEQWDAAASSWRLARRGWDIAARGRRAVGLAALLESVCRQTLIDKTVDRGSVRRGQARARCRPPPPPPSPGPSSWRQGTRQPASEEERATTETPSIQSDRKARLAGDDTGRSRSRVDAYRRRWWWWYGAPALISRPRGHDSPMAAGDARSASRTRRNAAFSRPGRTRSGHAHRAGLTIQKFGGVGFDSSLATPSRQDGTSDH